MGEHKLLILQASNGLADSGSKPKYTRMRYILLLFLCLGGVSARSYQEIQTMTDLRSVHNRGQFAGSRRLVVY